MYTDLSEKDCYSLLNNDYLAHLSYIYQDRPYVLPITYFYYAEKNAVICYSAEGHKMKAMRKNPQVALSVVDVDGLMQWKSVMVHGQFEQLYAADAKAYLHEFSLGVKDLIERKEKIEVSFISEFSSKLVNENLPMIFIIKIEDVTGKMRKEES